MVDERSQEAEIGHSKCCGRSGERRGVLCVALYPKVRCNRAISSTHDDKCIVVCRSRGGQCPAN